MCRSFLLLGLGTDLQKERRGRPGLGLPCAAGGRPIAPRCRAPAARRTTALSLITTVFLCVCVGSCGCEFGKGVFPCVVALLAAMTRFKKRGLKMGSCCLVQPAESHATPYAETPSIHTIGTRLSVLYENVPRGLTSLPCQSKASSSSSSSQNPGRSPPLA